MKAEDKAVARSFGGKRAATGKSNEQLSADEMEITSAGDVTFNITHPATGPSGSQSASAAPEKKAGAGWLPALAVGAAALVGGYLLHDAVKPTPEFSDTDTITEMDFPTK